MNRLRFLIAPALFLLAAGAATSIAAMNIGLVALLIVAVLAATPEERSRLVAGALPLLPWTVVTVLAILVSDRAPLSGLRFVFPFLTLPLAYAFFPAIDRTRWLTIFTAALGVASVLGIMQHIEGNHILELGLCDYQFDGPNTLRDTLFCGYKGGTRARGFFFTPMTFGAILMFGIIAATVILQTAGEKTKRLAALLPVFLVTLAVTSSRNAWFGLLGAIPVALGRHKRAWKWAFLGLLLAVGLVAASPVLRARIAGLIVLQKDPSTSTGARLFLWHDAWEQFKERPVLGWGPGTFSKNVQQRNPEVPLLSSKHAHNNYLHALAETGAVGLLGMLASWIWLALLSFRAPTRWGRIGVAAIAAFAVAGLFEANYLDSEVVINLLLWVAFAASPLPARPPMPTPETSPLTK